MKKINVVILQNETKNETVRWINACEKQNDKLDYSVVDITKNNWLDEINCIKPDLLLTKPSGLTSCFKTLYDERLYILNKEMGIKCFPTLDEVLIYENKRYFSYWLAAHQISHPKTHVFYFKDEAIRFIQDIDFPIIGKVNIGASGSGVRFLYNFDEAKKYINRTFSDKGADNRVGPNLQKGNILKRFIRLIFKPEKIVNKLKIYRAKAKDTQTDFVIIQEFIEHNFEWRVVRIGDSFFAHKKMKMGEKASGSLLKNYDNPPFEILDFVKEITDKFRLYSQAVDIFDTENGYLVNEMQCIFGQSDPHQMLVDDEPGRYLFKEGRWKFEKGNFNTNESFDLRLTSALELYLKSRL